MDQPSCMYLRSLGAHFFLLSSNHPPTKMKCDWCLQQASWPAPGDPLPEALSREGSFRALGRDMLLFAFHFQQARRVDSVACVRGGQQG